MPKGTNGSAPPPRAALRPTLGRWDFAEALGTANGVILCLAIYPRDLPDVEWARMEAMATWAAELTGTARRRSMDLLDGLAQTPSTKRAGAPAPPFEPFEHDRPVLRPAKVEPSHAKAPHGS